MEKVDKIKAKSQFGAAGYCLTVFLFFLYLNSFGLFGTKFIAGVVISWFTGGAIWFLRILFQSGDDLEGVDKPFGWMLFLLFPLFLPLALPLWIIPCILIVCYLITVAAFGGHGRHIFNPVIVAAVFMMYGYGDMGLIDASRPFPNSREGYNVWTAGIPPRADIRDIYSSIPAKSAFKASLNGLIPSIPGSCYGSVILLASLIFSLVFRRCICWWIVSAVSICLFGWLLPQPADFSIPFTNILFMGIMPSLLLCGIADYSTLPESALGQSINAFIFAGFAVFMLYNSSNILMPVYGFLLAQVVSPLVIDMLGAKDEQK